jgi:hypothetical protein
MKNLPTVNNGSYSPLREGFIVKFDRKGQHNSDFLVKSRLLIIPVKK